MNNISAILYGVFTFIIIASTNLIGQDNSYYQGLQNKLEHFQNKGDFRNAIKTAKEQAGLLKEAFGEHSEVYTEKINLIGFFYFQLGNYKQAEKYYLIVKNADKLSNRINEPSYAILLNNLGEVYSKLGFYNKAENYFIKSQEIYKKTYGIHHSSFLICLNNLGLIYYTKAEFEKAKNIFGKAISLNEKQNAVDSLAYAESCNNLASTYQMTGNYKQSEQLYKICIQHSAPYLSENDLKMGAYINNMAGLYKTIGKFDLAEGFYNKAIEITGKTTGENHIFYARALDNLAIFFQEQGRLDEAGVLFSKSQKILLSTTNEKSNEYATFLSNLGGYLQSTGSYDLAEGTLTEAYELKKKLLGPSHPDCVGILNNLGVLNQIIGKYSKADSIFIKAIKQGEITYGPDHIELAKILSNQADLYSETGSVSDFKKLYNRVIEIFKNSLGPDHPELARTFNNLAGFYLTKNENQKADSLLQLSFPILEEKLKTNHPLYIAALNNKAVLFLQTDKLLQAGENFHEILKSKKKIYGKIHPEYAFSLQQLGHYYNFMDKPDSAIFYYEKVNKLFEQLLGNNHPKTIENRFELAQLFEKEFNYSKANEFYELVKNSSDSQLQRGAKESSKISRNFSAAILKGQNGIKKAPIVRVYNPDPLKKNERGVNRIQKTNFTLKGFVITYSGYVDSLLINNQKINVLPDGVWEYSVNLQEGLNNFVVKVVSTTGSENSDTVQLLYENYEIVSNADPQKYLLAIGINNYNYEKWKSLNMPQKDVQDVLGVLQKKFHFTQVDTLLNENATYANVKSSIKKLISVTNSNDEVIIYFAGHGDYDPDFDEEGQWILSDGRLGNSSLATAISKLNARHVLILADACFSGSFYLNRGEEPVDNDAVNKLNSRWVIASGGMEKVADQMPGKQNSPFAWYLIDYLEKAENDVPVSILRSYLTNEIPKVTNQQPVSGPIPGDEGGEMILRIKD